jgi:hypothetical protein
VHKLTRRGFLASAIATVSLPTSLPAPAAAQAVPARRGQRLRVQFTPGGHTSPLQMYAMFEDPLFKDVEPTVLPHPNAFDTVGAANAPDVIATGRTWSSIWMQGRG